MKSEQASELTREVVTDEIAKRMIDARNSYLVQYPGNAVGGMRAALHAYLSTVAPQESGAVAWLIKDYNGNKVCCEIERSEIDQFINPPGNYTAHPLVHPAPPSPPAAPLRAALLALAAEMREQLIRLGDPTKTQLSAWLDRLTESLAAQP